MVNRIYLCLIGLCTLLIFSMPTFAVNSSLEATVDRSQLALGETFTLNIELMNTQASGEPNTKELEQDFSILNSGSSQNTRIINGNYSSSTLWQYILAPKREGHLTIPSFNVAGQSSQPIDILVTATSATSQIVDRNIKIEVNLDKDSAYPNEQIKLQIRLLRGIDADRENLTDLSVDNAELMQNGEPKKYLQTISGQRFRVYEVNYLLFPTGNGDVIIQPVTFSGLFRLGRYQPQYREFKSDQQIVKINTKPKLFTDWWLPAQTIQLSTSIEPQKNSYMVGDTLTQTTIIQAQGLKAEQLPAIKLPDIDGLNYYAEPPKFENTLNEQGVNSTRIDTNAIVATKPGQYTLPEQKIKWWNTNTKSIEILTIPAKQFEIKANPLLNPPALVNTQQINVSTPPESSQDARPAATVPEQITLYDQYGLTLLISLTLSLLVNIILITWLFVTKTRLSRAKGKALETSDENAAQYQQSIKSACQNQQAKRCFEQANLWARQQGYLHCSAWIESLNNSAFMVEFQKLEAYCYHPQGQQEIHVDFKGLWQYFEQGFKQTTQKRKPSSLPDF